MQTISIVYMHWGVEKSNRPVEYQKQYVPKMVEAGANAIVGSHPLVTRV